LFFDLLFHLIESAIACILLSFSNAFATLSIVFAFSSFLWYLLVRRRICFGFGISIGFGFASAQLVLLAVCKLVEHRRLALLKSASFMALRLPVLNGICGFASIAAAGCVCFRFSAICAQLTFARIDTSASCGWFCLASGL
jgi:hypothetical protein